jgi:hypothetical protein
VQHSAVQFNAVQYSAVHSTAVQDSRGEVKWPQHEAPVQGSRSHY